MSSYYTIQCTNSFLELPHLDPAIADRVLIARLSLDPSGAASTTSDNADDSVMLTVLASLDENETSWDWLVGCWKRCEKEKGKARKVSHPSMPPPAPRVSFHTIHAPR